MKPDPFVVALEGFFLRFNHDKITLPADDVALIAAWLCEIPAPYGFLRDQFAAGFACALDLLRRQRDLRWTN